MISVAKKCIIRCYTTPRATTHPDPPTHQPTGRIRQLGLVLAMTSIKLHVNHELFTELTSKYVRLRCTSSIIQLDRNILILEFPENRDEVLLYFYTHLVFNWTIITKKCSRNRYNIFFVVFKKTISGMSWPKNKVFCNILLIKAFHKYSIPS